MEVLKAIYTRRAIRNFADTMVTSDVLLPLLHAAVQAPSGLNQQPWAFAVYQGRHKLHEYSQEAKQVFLSNTAATVQETSGAAEMLNDPHFDIFYNANTLVVILAKPMGLNPADDCFLAAQNFMLAAHSQGLGTCPIGFARPWFNLPQTKRRLDIPIEMTVVFPLIIGYPQETPDAPPRNEPEIVAWDVSRLDQLRAPAAV